MERIAKHVLAVAVVGILVLLGLTGGALSQDVTYERLLNADKEPHNWLTYYGNYGGWRYSPLKQINTSNVKKLVVKWAFQTGADQNFQVTPIVADGVMYITNYQNQVFALDAATGKMLWRFSYKLPDPGKMPLLFFGSTSHRGVALAKGKVLLATLDAHLLALDAKTGRSLWDVRVGDWEEGPGFTSPPLIVKDKAIIGMPPGEFPIRGHIDAYDVETGKLVWRFSPIPKPGEPGGETWDGDSWQFGCGAPVLPGTYDPELNLVYFGTSNPCPAFDGEDRPGDNLHSNSIIALDPDSGSVKWSFQASPHDVWEFDAWETILVDTEIQGKPAKALLQANKNGYLYALDRTDGRLLYAKPFVARINWTRGLDAQGRPNLGVVPTPEGAFICPSNWGAKNWGHVAYSPQTELIYIPAMDMCMEAKVVRQKPRRGGLYFGGEGRYLREGAHGLVEALDVRTGEISWQYRTKYPMFGSVLATGGGLIFAGDPEGNFRAFDAANGKPLWSFNTGSGHRGSAISYAVGGKQYVAVPSGWGGVAMLFLPQTFPELEDATSGSTLFVFGLFEE